MNSRASWAAVGCGGRLVVAVSAAEASARAASAACLDAARSRCRPSSVTLSFSRSWVSGHATATGTPGHWCTCRPADAIFSTASGSASTTLDRSQTTARGSSASACSIARIRSLTTSSSSGPSVSRTNTRSVVCDRTRSGSAFTGCPTRRPALRSARTQVQPGQLHANRARSPWRSGVGAGVFWARSLPLGLGRCAEITPPRYICGLYAHCAPSVSPAVSRAGRAVCGGAASQEPLPLVRSVLVCHASWGCDGLTLVPGDARPEGEAVGTAGARAVPSGQGRAAGRARLLASPDRRPREWGLTRSPAPP